MLQVDIIWLAAWLEGEGWFGLSKGSISVQATSTDYDIVQRAAYLMEAAKIYEKKKQSPSHKQAFTVKITGKRAETVMRLIRPFVGLRRGATIDTLLEHREGSSLRRSEASKRRWSDPVFKAKTSKAIAAARKGGGNQYTNRILTPPRQSVSCP